MSSRAVSASCEWPGGYWAASRRVEGLSKPRGTLSTAALTALIVPALWLSACTQPSVRPGYEAEATLFDEACADCHTPEGNERTPSAGFLRLLSPHAIVASLEEGGMRAEGAKLTREQRLRLAEYLTGRDYAEGAFPESAFCGERGEASLDLGAIASMGFGGNLAGTGFQSPELAGLDAADVPKLELRWAFAFPNASQLRTKPTVAGDVLLVGGPFGEVLALDMASGCVRWSFEADAAVRGAVVAGEGPEGRPTVWFVDFLTNAYAVDVAKGSVLWKRRVAWHPLASNTGSPALHGGRLVVPVSSFEISVAADPRYPCCTSSGAVAALDAMTGEVLWYHRVISDPPRPDGANGIGVQRFTPSGAPVWSSPTVDAGRGRVYVGTGQSYTRPATDESDAILALDIATGELAWSFQATPGDAFNSACEMPRYRENCPDDFGPDFDFGMAPMLVTRADGKEILVAGQKSGMVWALDPDDDGALLWSTPVGKGSTLGGIHWGMAADGRYAYAPNSDRMEAVIVDVNPEREPSPGLHALDLMTGEVVWSAPVPEGSCRGKRGCYATHSAAPTAIPGVVFAGGLDGHIRAYATEDGRVLWDFDTSGVRETTNGVPGKGGAIDGPGPVVARGMLFVNSGYGSFGQMPGNLLLAFGVGGKGGDRGVPPPR